MKTEIRRVDVGSNCRRSFDPADTDNESITFDISRETGDEMNFGHEISRVTRSKLALLHSVKATSYSIYDYSLTSSDIEFLTLEIVRVSFIQNESFTSVIFLHNTTRILESRIRNTKITLLFVRIFHVIRALFVRIIFFVRTFFLYINNNKNNIFRENTPFTFK